MHNFNYTPANYVSKCHLNIKTYSNISDTPNSNNKKSIIATNIGIIARGMVIIGIIVVI